jgi:hypothetical protein
VPEGRAAKRSQLRPTSSQRAGEEKNTFWSWKGSTASGTRVVISIVCGSRTRQDSIDCV